MTVQEGYTDYNRFADFWRYDIGVNVIPADTRHKITYIEWSQWQDNPIHDELHNQWKEQNAFKNGMAVILGRVWHRPDLANYYLVGIDADNKKAIEEICNFNNKPKSIHETAAVTIVEQHNDNPNKAHFYFYTTRPIKGKSSDQNRLSDKISANDVPAIEIKSLGNHGLLYCSPSVHKNGYSYEIVGIRKPAVLDEALTDEFEKHLDTILTKYGIDYLSCQTYKAATSIEGLFKPGHKVMKGHNRHEDLLRVMDSLIAKLKDIYPLERIKQLAREHNTTEFYEEPINDVDFERQWKQAIRFIESKSKTDIQVSILEDPADERTRVRKLVDSIMEEHTFVTMTDNGELYHFNGKIYEPGQEWIIKEKCRLLESKTTTHEVQEVINYIKDLTYKNRLIFDSNPDLLVVKNGVLNIQTLELKPHSPDHCALSMLPVIYDPKAKCPLFAKFLSQILQPKYVSVMLQFVGYCLYKSAKYEKAALCIGKGDNGKSTFLKWIDGFIGRQNVSHASLQDLSGGNRFAAADLYGKMINTFADLKSEKLQDTGPFKMLVSGDSIRAEKKYGIPFNFENYAKLIFSCNNIPQSGDEGYAYFKRWLIFHFDSVFTSEERDINLFDKISTPEEYSGALNLVLISLRQLIKNNGFTETDDIETVKEDYELNSSTVASFVHDTCEITLNEEDDIICNELHDAYVQYCRNLNVTALRDTAFGQELKQLRVHKRYTKRNYEPVYVYMGIKLKAYTDQNQDNDKETCTNCTNNQQQLL